MTAATWNTKPYPNRCPKNDPCGTPCCPNAATVEHRISRTMRLRSFMIQRFDAAGYAVRQMDVSSPHAEASMLECFAELAHDVGPSFAMILDPTRRQPSMRKRQVRPVSVRLELDRDDARLQFGIRRNPGE